MWERFSPPFLVFVRPKLSNELVGVSAVRKNQDFYFDIFRQKSLNRALCRVYSRTVTIIVDDNLARKSCCQFRLISGQRGSQACDHIADAVLKRDQKIEITLDQNCKFLLSNLFSRYV